MLDHALEQVFRGAAVLMATDLYQAVVDRGLAKD
jgi:hypothetical protein